MTTICGDLLLQVESRVDQGRVLCNCFTCALLRKSITFVLHEVYGVEQLQGYFLFVITTTCTSRSVNPLVREENYSSLHLHRPC